MNICARKLSRIIAIAIAVPSIGLAGHYYARLPLLKHTVVLITPGKWMWVECQTPQFSATIEAVTATGIVASVDAPLVKGLPCEAVGVVTRGEYRYFFPFRTVLGIDVNGKRAWSNPFPM